MKKNLVSRPFVGGLAITALAATLTACGASGEEAASEYVVGLQSDQSGPARATGEGQVKGIKAAFDAINAAGGVNGKKIKLVVRDDAGDAARTVTAYRELTDQYSVSAVIGLVNSGEVPPLAPLAARDGVALLSTGVPSDLLDPVQESVFMTNADIAAQGRAELDYIKRAIDAGEVPANPKIAVLHYATPAGEAFTKAVGAYATSLGLSLGTSESTPVGAATMNSQMQAIAASKPDVVLLMVSGPDVVLTAKAAKASGLPADTMFVNYSFGATPQTLQAVSDIGYDNYSASSSFDLPGGVEESEATEAFAAASQKAGVDPAGLMIAEGYAMGELVADVLERCGDSCPAEKFRTTLEETSTDLDGLAFGPIIYTGTNHHGASAVRFRQWDKAAGTFRYDGDPITLVFT